MGTPALLVHVCAVVFTLQVVLVGALGVTFGPNYARVAIQLLYGAAWASTDAPQLLSLYCFSLLVLAQFVLPLVEGACVKHTAPMNTNVYIDL